MEYDSTIMCLRIALIITLLLSFDLSLILLQLLNDKKYGFLFKVIIMTVVQLAVLLSSAFIIKSIAAFFIIVAVSIGASVLLVLCKKKNISYSLGKQNLIFSIRESFDESDEKYFEIVI